MRWLISVDQRMRSGAFAKAKAFLLEMASLMPDSPLVHQRLREVNDRLGNETARADADREIARIRAS